MLEADGQARVSMRQAYASPRSFAHFDLELNGAEKAARQQLSVRRTGSHDNFGHVPALATEVADFVVSLGNTLLVGSCMAHAIARVTSHVISTFDAETAWVSLRASVPNHAFDTPRWHVDGYFFRPYSGDQRKVVMTLKGPATLFCQLSAERREAFLGCARRNQSNPMGVEARAELARIIDAGGLVETSGEMQGTILTVGDRETAAIHSEPPISSERLFLSIVSGSREQVRELQGRWGVGRGRS